MEPGIYIPSDMEEAPKEFRGIGIRIEDDILITSSGHEVLSSGVPKSIDEIEALVGSESLVKPPGFYLRFC